MTKYEILLNILDQIRNESNGTVFAQRYLPSATETEQLNQARGRAFVHLYLKVRFGLLNFKEREHLVTDGGYDGGIDGYYIDQDEKLVYFLQSKFRTTERNFLEKQIGLEEVLVIDITRILDGHQNDERGNKYNGKILQLQREISSVGDIARYKYKVIILANLDIPPARVSRLVGNIPCEVIDYSKCFDLLVFPVISGTYFNASDLVIHLDLSNKNAGSKISYTVDTRYGECDITVLFVPTVEIARSFYRYKNSILKFNPRSYLELAGADVNEAISQTILQDGKNEFALYNNGITMLSDETNLNEKIGQRNKAQLNIKNPQIINGGQTAYTLSRIFEEQNFEERVFLGKEVLLKIITLSNESGASMDDKLKLIDAISTATNRQTTVLPADRYSHDRIHLDIQAALFERFGLLYERKRGEFEDGIHLGYISRSQVVERNLFFRVFHAANGRINVAATKRIFASLSQTDLPMPSDLELDRFYFGYLCLPFFGNKLIGNSKKKREIFAKIYAMVIRYMPESIEGLTSIDPKNIGRLQNDWASFISAHAKDPLFLKKTPHPITGDWITYFEKNAMFRSLEIDGLIRQHFAKEVSVEGVG
jgi:hypothetical protein